MDRTEISNLAAKKFVTPRSVLKLCLFLSLMANLALGWWVFSMWGKSVEADSDAERIGFSAGYELAKSDVRNRLPRYFRLKVVDFNSRATYEFEQTEETYRGLPVWEWRWANPYFPDRPLTLPQHFVDIYNGTVINLLEHERIAK